MTTSLLTDKACIAGAGATPQGRLPGKSGDDISIWALRLALEDCGLNKSDLDGLLVQHSFGGGGDLKDVGRRLGIEPRISHSIDAGAEGLLIAASLVATGVCRYVACMYGTNQRTNRNTFARPAYNLGGNFDEVYGLSNPGSVAAFNFRRRMHDFGATERQLGAVAVSQSKHAALNPLAVFRDPITIDDYLAARNIIWPLRLMDFCMISDGGFAFIVTTPERAKALRKTPVYIHAAGAQTSFLDIQHSRAMYHPTQEANARMLWDASDFKQKDVDLMYVQDAFTPNVFSALENYGFCDFGTAHQWVQDGKIELGGALPVNVNGGQNRMTYMVGWHNTYDAVQQLRHEAQTPARQVPNAGVALCTYSSGHWRETWSFVYRR